MRTNKRRWTVSLLLTSSLAFALSGCGAAGSKSAGGAAKPGESTAAKPAAAASSGETKLAPALRIGYISANNKGTITGVEGWAQKKGYLESELKKYGVTEITVKSFPNGPNLNEALASGVLDIGIYGDTPAINGRAVGLKTKLINITQSGMNAWLLTQADGPKSLEELKGKKIATADGSYMSRYLKGLLLEKGLEKDVKVVHLLPPDGDAALARGDIAAYAFPTGFGPQGIAKGCKVLDEAKNHPDLRGSSVTVGSEDYLSKNPGFVKVWNSIRERAAKEVQANGEEFYQLYAEASGYSLDVVKASFELKQWPLEAVPAEGLKLLEGTKKYLADNGIIKKDFKLDDWVYKP